MSEENKPSFLEKLNMPLSQLWSQYRLFLIGFGVLILIFKFREVIIDLLVSSARKTVDEAQKQDTQLRQDETKANTQANDLRQQAEDLGKNKPKVDEDWHKK